jgi:hypothetical protein
MITITTVVSVSASMKPVNELLRTSMLLNCDPTFPQLSLNCLMMLLTFSKRSASWKSFEDTCEITYSKGRGRVDTCRNSVRY